MDKNYGQFGRILTLMEDGKWRTLQEIADATGVPIASVHPRLSQMRKPECGGFRVDKRTRSHYLNEYRVVHRDQQMEMFIPPVTPRQQVRVLKKALKNVLAQLHEECCCGDGHTVDRHIETYFTTIGIKP